MNSFSKTSKAKLNTCHIDLQTIMEVSIRYSKIDFGIAEGHRSLEKQQLYYNQGKSKIDGVIRKGKHNYQPSMAVDIYAYVAGKARWSKTDLMYLTGVIDTVASMLLEEGRITHKIRFGSNWDMDGEFITDQTFQDLPHIELI
jgi:peptidoglycan L-alanyl-D-glutamate endopeptidase CwlK